MKAIKPQANQDGTNRKQTGDVLFHHIQSAVLAWSQSLLRYIQGHEMLQKEEGPSRVSLPMTTNRFVLMIANIIQKEAASVFQWP